MNLILLHETDRTSEQEFRLTDHRAEHIRSVLQSKVGDRLRVGLLDGPPGTGTVASLDDREVCLHCEFEDIPSRPLVSLILAIPRPKSLRKLLPEVTAFGIDRLVLLRTWRVAKPFLSVDVLEPGVYRALLHEGLMQGRHTLEPRVRIEPLFKPFVEDRLDEMFAESHLRLVAHPGATRSIAEVVVQPNTHVVAAIGPEGGFVPFELEALQRRGFEPVHLGPSTLRVETACVALLAQLQLLRMLQSAAS